MSSSTALAKRSAETALMPPPPAPKRIKRPPKVLDEETYTSALSHIIARDFFPGLLETESQQDYLNALDAGDEDWIEEAEKRVKEVLDTPRGGRRGVGMTPRAGGSETPRGWIGQTPLRTPVSATPARSVGGETKPQEEPVNINLSLEAFQAKYTSEDNESFNKVLDKQNAKKREKYGWLWNSNKIPSARQIAQAAREQKLLTQAQSSSTALTLRPSQDQDLRRASISQRPHDPMNNFMFIPPSLDDTHPALQSTFSAAQDRSRAAPKSVQYASTRLPTSLQPDEDDGDDTASVSLSAIDAAIAGHLPPSSHAPSIITTGGGETPRVNGYAFVDEEPTPAELGVPQAPPPPTRRHKPNDALLRRLIEAHGGGAGSTSSGKNPFSIQESSKREDLHHRMVDKQLATQRATSATNLQNINNSKPSGGRLATLRSGQTPRFLSSPVIGARLGATPRDVGTPGVRRERRREDLTPAARSLYERVGRTPVDVGGGGAFDAGRVKGRDAATPVVRRGG